jgi:hypothetical protein
MKVVRLLIISSLLLSSPFALAGKGGVPPQFQLDYVGTAQLHINSMVNTVKNGNDANVAATKTSLYNQNSLLQSTGAHMMTNPGSATSTSTSGQYADSDSENREDPKTQEQLDAEGAVVIGGGEVAEPIGGGGGAMF